MLLKFTTEAYSRFDDWSNQNQAIIDDPETHPALQSHFVKFEALVPKIAGIFHVIDYEGKDVPYAIPAETCKRAICFVEYLRSHARRIYALGVQPEITNAQTILKRFDRLEDVFTLRDIRRKSWIGLSKTSDIENALTVLVEHGYVRSEVKAPVSGRPTVLFHKHPEFRLTKPTKSQNSEVSHDN